MATTLTLDDRFRQYVLGQLDEAGVDDVEVRAFDDPDVAAAIDEIETDMVDDYVAGTLREADRHAFEHALTTRPRLRARVDVARALAARRASAPRRAWWRPALATAALLALGGVWLLIGGTRHAVTPEPVPSVAESTQTAPATPEGDDGAATHPAGQANTPGAGSAPTTPAPPARVVFAVQLPMGTTRGAVPTTATVPARATHVLLRVPIAEGDDYASYRVRVIGEGGAVAHDQTATTLAPDRTLALVIERTALPDALYDVSLEGIDATGIVEPLAFLQVRLTSR
ncbi:MAG: hypothetical protein IT182_02380 [Acidobacteria bacterium]|nr:hypothetical protein [Acidobacteriota bacterium]